jgi:hypothetical protein
MCFSASFTARLHFNDDFSQSVECGYYAASAGACSGYLGYAAPVDADDPCSESLQSLNPLRRTFLTIRCDHAASPFERTVTIRPPRLPVAPATMMVDGVMFAHPREH